LNQSPVDHQPTQARPEDISSPDSIITTLYELVSGPQGERDWHRMRTLYLEGARLFPTGVRANGERGLKILSIDDWITGARNLFLKSGFYEVEIARTTERFGNIVHAFSTYEARWNEDDEEPFIRGINSIQLLKREGRWWIVNVFWDNEGEDNPIPEAYLP